MSSRRSDSQPPGRDESKVGVAISGGCQAATGAPVPGAIVTGRWGAGRASFLTGRDGRFVLTDVPSDAVALEATKTGYFPADPGGVDPVAAVEPLRMPDGASVDNIVLRMRPSATFRHRADAMVTPVPGITGAVGTGSIGKRFASAVNPPRTQRADRHRWAGNRLINISFRTAGSPKVGVDGGPMPCGFSRR